MSKFAKIKHYLWKPRFHFNRVQFNLVAVFFLSIGFVIGTYLTLNKFYPQIFALNDTQQTWTFDSSSADDYAKSQVEVNDLGAYPGGGQVGANELANPSFEFDTDAWLVAAKPSRAFLAEVPGDELYGTQNFLVMQYEAKYDCTGDELGDTPAACNAYADSAGGLDYRDLADFDKDKVVSSPFGAPIVHITHEQALNACPTNFHLITNAEWMTIARNAETQAINWADGVVGSKVSEGGGLKRGNVEQVDSVGYNGADPEYGTERSDKAVVFLSNGAGIWDLSGNVWEHVQLDAFDTLIPQNQQPTLYSSADDASGLSGPWAEFIDISSYGMLSYDQIRPSNSNYNAEYGVGRIWTYGDNEYVNTNHVIHRGGSWGAISDAGLFTMNLGHDPDFQNLSVGYRCASDTTITQSHDGDSGFFANNSSGGNTIVVGPASDGKLYQIVNLGDEETYDFSVYVYNKTAGSEGTAVDENVASLYYDGLPLDTTYEPVADDWYKLSGTLTGGPTDREYGLLIKAGKTVAVDEFTLARQGTYSVITTTYQNEMVSSWDTFCEGTLEGDGTCNEDATSSDNSGIRYQICTDDGTTCEAGSSWQYYDGDSWETASNSTSHSNDKTELTQAAMQALPVESQKISIKAIFTFSGNAVPYLPHLSIGLTTDNDPPEQNAKEIVMYKSNGGTQLSTNNWTNNPTPYFSWTAGADNEGGSGIRGYCLYLGTDANGNPATSKGLLGTSPVDTTGSTCQFLTTATSLDLAVDEYRGDPWLSSSNSSYYLNVKALDNAGNVYGGASAQFQFRFDDTPPSNVVYISCAAGSFSNVADMNFSWPTAGTPAAKDDHAGLLGWQYQINSTNNTWLGTRSSALIGSNSYLPLTDSVRTLTQDLDAPQIVAGGNIIYFRTVDLAGNVSPDATMRTCNLSYGGAAPSFANLSAVTVSPTDSSTNAYALSWPSATAAAGQNIAHYYYMINTPPPTTLATLQSNSSTYIDNGNSVTVAETALANVNKGSNTVYVVAVDDAGTPNYSPSNYISGTFTLNSNNPDNVSDLVASDSSIKNLAQWNVTLTWAAPSYQGAGNLTYLIYRSSDGQNFTQVGSSTGLSYVDNTPSSTNYFYKVYTRDGANALSSGTNAVSITPTGKWTSPPSLDADPKVTEITTRRATISWSTSRSADSKIQYGTKSGSYEKVEPSNSAQVSSHSLQLSGLNPATTYYYRVKWTDEDGNTGISAEKTFKTSSAPTVKEVSVRNLGLSSATIQFTIQDASKVKIYYGTSTSFGGAKEISTAQAETTYTMELDDLLDGTKYYYKINTFDSDGSEYEGTVLDFATLPRPKITGVKIQQVMNTAQSTLLVTWTSNTDISSIVTYYPQDKPGEVRNEVDVTFVKGEHKMLIRGLAPETNYTLIVKGRDQIGNEAVSDAQSVTTATDTRPPQVSDFYVEGTVVPQAPSTAQESTAQLIVSWNTDEPATSQVEFGEGTGTTYNSKTQEDSNLTYNHLVIISGLTPSKVYHLRALSKDKAANLGNSIDTVTITPKITDNALNLVISNLQEAFGFLNGFKQ